MGKTWASDTHSDFWLAGAQVPTGERAQSAADDTSRGRGLCGHRDPFANYGRGPDTGLEPWFRKAFRYQAEVRI
jgi:hypothetical protein